MFPSDSSFNPFDLFAQEAYSVNLPFEHAQKLIQGAARYFELPTTEDFLLIELKDGVFARACSPDWVKALNGLKGDDEQPWATAIGERRWTDLTTRHRAPLRSFGDERLARWKVGF